MKIRSITYFCNPGWPLKDDVLRAAGSRLSLASAAFVNAGYEVQSTRLATVPFPNLLGGHDVANLPRLVQDLEGTLGQTGIGYGSVGPALPDVRESYAPISEAISVSERIFFGAVIASPQDGIDLWAVRAAAKLMVANATIQPNGFSNLRFAALANVPAGSPFFPAAYHDGVRPAFAIATEGAGLAVEAFTTESTLRGARQMLTAEIERHARVIESTAREALPDVDFGGVDFSLAPYPSQDRSLGTAFERMGVRRVGLHGSLTAAAILTEAIQAAGFHRAGFSGLMLPVLEDSALAEAASEGVLSVADLLLYSAVCGTGLDTIPLAGDVTAEELATVLLDLATLSSRLHKPLTARLMPIPGKRPGDPTDFNFEYFAPGRVLALKAEPLRGALAGEGSLRFLPR